MSCHNISINYSEMKFIHCTAQRCLKILSRHPSSVRHYRFEFIFRLLAVYTNSIMFTLHHRLIVIYHYPFHSIFRNIHSLPRIRTSPKPTDLIMIRMRQPG